MSTPGVLLLGNYPPPYGGVPQHLSQLAPYLVSRGWNVHVVSGGRAADSTADGVSVYRYRIQRVPIELARGIRRPARLLNPVLLTHPRLWAGYFYRLSVARRLIENHNIVLISAYNLITAGPVAAVLAEESGLPLVVTNFGELHNRPAFVKAHGGLLRHISSTASALLSCSEHCARSYGLLAASPGVRVIPYGVDTEQFSPSLASDVRQRLGWSINDRVLLYVGRMVSEMGLNILMDSIPLVLARAGEIRFIIAGAEGELSSAARGVQAAYPRNVFVATDVRPSCLPAYFSAATAVVVPTVSDRGCSSLAAMEAMASGRPVIAARVGGIPEVVEDGVTGVLIPPADATRLAHEVVLLLSDPTRMLRMGAAARARAIESFDHTVTNQRVGDVFDAVTAREVQAKLGNGFE